MKLILFFAFLFATVHLLNTDCQNVDCPSGFRCSEGICIRQKYAPKKTLCAITFETSLIKCTTRDSDCTGVSSAPACGYTFQGKKIDYPNDCLPCVNEKISFYYPMACSEAPEVCQPNEECINGKCLKMFNSKKYKDYRTCSSNSQCRAIVDRCVAGKCVSITELTNTLRKSKGIPSAKRH